MKTLLFNPFSIVIAFSLLITACTSGESPDSAADTTSLTWESVQDSTARLHTVTGFAGPEAVRYDPDQDVYFVSNFNGQGGARDANGFISRVTPEGEIEELEFMTGTEDAPMHAPRGMYIVDGTLWVADADGVHGFDKSTGDHVAFVDFTEHTPGFLNDVAADENGNLYVTDTGAARLYRVEGDEVTVVVEELPYSPNGITPTPSGEQMVLAPWNGVLDFQAWNEGSGELSAYTSATGGGNYDGIEFVGDRLLAASQMDSSLHVLENGMDSVIIQMPGRPADIGIDTERNQVAVPYVARNEVDIWQLPGE